METTPIDTSKIQLKDGFHSEGKEGRGLVLIIDSREQAPLIFREGVFEKSIVRALPVGDYGCEVNGKLIPIIGERKSLQDLFSTLGSKNYERFRREIHKAKELNIKLVLLIEGTMREVAVGYERSTFDGNSMLKKLAMLYVKYDLEYHFCSDRREMSRRIEDTFEAVQRWWKKEKKI